MDTHIVDIVNIGYIVAYPHRISLANKDKSMNVPFLRSDFTGY
jgi:hypothetical protein